VGSRHAAARRPRFPGGTRARRRCTPPRWPSSAWGRSELRGDRGRSDAFEARVRAMPGEGFAGANVTVPHKGAALSLADELSETAREIGAANTLVFATGRSELRTPTPRGFCTRSPARRAASRPWSSVPAGPRARSSGHCCARVPRCGLEPHRAALAAPLRGTRRRDRRRTCPGAYELIVNTTAVGLGGEDPFAELPLEAAAFHDRSRPWSTWSTAVRPRPCSAPPMRPRRHGRRHRDPRPAGRPLARKLGPAGRHRSTRCASPPELDGPCTFLIVGNLS